MPNSQQAEDQKTDDKLPLEFRIKQIEKGVERAEQNIKIFSQEVQKQTLLKAQLQAELTQLKAQSKQ